VLLAVSVVSEPLPTFHMVMHAHAAAWALLLLMPSVVQSERQKMLVNQEASSSKTETLSMTNLTRQGVGKGQTLTIELTGWQIGGTININAGQDIALQVQMKEVLGKKKLVRRSQKNGNWRLDEAWGGWPLGANSAPVKFEFTLTESEWQTKVNGERHPWFDYKFIPPMPTITAYSLTDLTASSQSVADKVCTTKCKVGSGMECPSCDQNPNTICLSKPMPMAPRDCGQDSSQEYCCEGTKRPVLPVNNIAEGDAVSMVNAIEGDATYLDRTCASADIHGTCGDLKDIQSQSTVHKMRVLSKEVDEDGPTGRVLVFVPKLGTSLYMSSWSLLSETKAGRTATYPGGGDPSLVIDEATGQIRRAQGNSASQLSWGHYITRINDRYQFTMPRLRAFAAGSATYTITTSDVPQLTSDPTCVTDWQWRDRDGALCAKYQTNAWCTRTGLTTDAWHREKCFDVSGVCDFAAKADLNEKAASDACCFCGGGEFGAVVTPVPTPAPPGPPTPVPTPAPSPPDQCAECFGEEEDGTKEGVIATFSVVNGDYPILSADEQLANDFKVAVKAAVVKEIEGLDSGFKDTTNVQVVAGSIQVIVRCWHAASDKVEAVFDMMKQKTDKIKDDIVIILTEDKYKLVVPGGARVEVVGTPSKVLLSGGGRQVNTGSWWEQLLASVGIDPLYLAAGGAGVLVLLCCSCFAMRSSGGAGAGNSQLPLPEGYDESQQATETKQPAREQDSKSAASKENDDDDRRGDRRDDRRDDRKGDRRDRDDRQEESRDDREEESRDDRDGKRSTSRRSDAQDRSLSRAQSDASMVEDGTGQLVPPHQRGRRHRPSPRRQER